MNQQTVHKFWSTYCESEGIDPTSDYDSWAFGEGYPMANEILERVMSGKKTSKTGLIREHELKEWRIPVKGDKVVVLDQEEEPRCIIEFLEVEHMKFWEMKDLDYIKKDCLGFETLESWRKCQWGFYFQVLASYGEEFHKDMKIFCSKIKVIYTPKVNCKLISPSKYKKSHSESE